MAIGNADFTAKPWQEVEPLMHEISEQVMVQRANPEEVKPKGKEEQNE